MFASGLLCWAIFMSYRVLQALEGKADGPLASPYDRRWVVMSASGPAGPYSDSELRALVKQCEVLPETRVRLATSDEFVPASAIPGLFS